MAQPPMAMPAAGAAGGMMGADPTAGADPGADADAGNGERVLLTICKKPDGTYTIYQGDEPDADDGGGGADMSEDDADAMGAAGGAPAPGAGGMGGDMGGDMGGGGGTPADSKGAVLKVVLDALNADESSGASNADDQLQAGFSANQSPTPASGPGQKY